MAALGVPAHARARRALTGAACAASLLAACGVETRDDLVGRYVSGGQDGETWSLAADGTCVIARPGVTLRCEWEFAERDGWPALSVTLLPEPGVGTPHRTRLVLTPSRLPGGVVTIPLPAGGELRRVE